MNSDFDDNFGGPPDSYTAYHTGIDPLLIMLLIVFAVVIAGFVALVVYAGRQRGWRRLRADRVASAEAIYNSVRYHLRRALQSPGGAMLERGREVADVIEARLGFVLALKNRPGKLIDALDKALAGKAEKPAADPAPVKVKTPLPTESHYLEVWKALQALSRIWEDKPRIMALIEAAQTELSERPRDVARPATAAEMVTEALEEANRGTPFEPAPETVPVAPDTTPPDPEPPAPRPPRRREKRAGKEGEGEGAVKRKSSLPPHKRNMLA